MTVNTPYTLTCSPIFGNPPYNISVASGAVPTGMTATQLGSEFVVEGSPTVISNYQFTVQVTDNSGHSNSQAFSISVTNGSVGTGGGLSLSSLSQTSAAANTAFTLTLFGSGFTSSCVVIFNGINVGANFNGSTQLTASIPASYVTGSIISVYVHDNSSGASSGSLSISVTNGGSGGTGVSISSISPTSTPLSTPFTLYIFGSGFTQGQLISFGSTSYSSNYLGSSELSVNIPASALTASGTVNVSVAGSNSEPFTIGAGGSTGTLNITCTTSTGPMTVGTFYTEFCSVSGGNGTYFWSTTNLPSGLQLTGTSGSSIGISGTPTVVQSYTVNVSDNAGHQGTLTVSPNGSIGSSGYSLSSLSPVSLPVNSGSTTVSVFGSGFTGSSQVYFNGNLLSTQFVSTNQLNAIIPSNLLTLAGSYNVFVYTSGLNSTNSVTFTVGTGSGTTGVVLSSISPTSVPVNSAGFTLNLFGSGFNQGALISFGPYTFSATFINSSQMSVFIPSNYLTTSQTLNVSVGGSNSVQFVIGTGSTGTGSLTLSCSPTTGPTTIGNFYQQSCFASGGTAPYTFSVSGLPSGVNQSANNGGSTVTISGSPTVSQSYSYTVFVSDSSGRSGSLPISGSISTSGSSYNITSLAPASAAVGSAGFTLTVFGNGFSGGSFVYFNGSQLSTQYVNPGVLNATLPASFLSTAETANVTVNTSGINTNSQTFTVGSGGTSTGGTLTVSCTPGVGPSTVNSFYSITCSASGGNQPYNWPSPSGLPAYLSYSTTTGSTVTISGTPNVSVPYNFSIKVTDSSSPVQTGSLQIAGETGASNTTGGTIVLTSLTPTSAAVGSTAVTLNIFGSGFSTNSQVIFDGFAVATTYFNAGQVSATVPNGLLTFASSVLVSVTTPGAGSSNALTFVIGNGGSGVQMTITCTPGIGPATPNSYYTSNCGVNGGTGPYNWSVVSGSLPTGLALSPNGGTSSINGYTTLNGPYSYTLQVTDSSSPANVASLVIAGETGAGTIGTSGLSITTLSPASTPVGSGALTITVLGNGFTTASQVYYNGAPVSDHLSQHFSVVGHYSSRRFHRCPNGHSHRRLFGSDLQFIDVHRGHRRIQSDFHLM